MGGRSKETLGRVQDLWREILAIEDIGPEDDFFTLGGDSIQIVEMMARIQEEFGILLDSIEIVDAPILRDFARVVESAASGVVSDAMIDGAV